MRAWAVFDTNGKLVGAYPFEPGSVEAEPVTVARDCVWYGLHKTLYSGKEYWRSGCKAERHFTNPKHCPDCGGRVKVEGGKS